MKFFVSRQMYWPDGNFVVEIAAGGRDYANPDMLGARFPGEGEEYEDPREAARVAIDVAKRWKARIPDQEISIASGFTNGFTMPFEPSSEPDIIAWADKLYNELPKCDVCGNLLPEEHLQDESGEHKFCRVFCAESAEDKARVQ